MPSRPGGAGGRPRRQPHPNITLPGVACRSISPSPGHRRPGGATDGFRGLYPPSRPWHGLCTPPQTPDLKHIDRRGLEVTWLISGSFRLNACTACSVSWLRLTLCDPHGLQPAGILCPWNSPGKDTGVGCHSLLQGLFLIQRSEPTSPPSPA